MVKTRERKTKRLTITLGREEYEQLTAIAKGHRPHMSLQYVLEYAVQYFLDRAKNHKLIARMRDPLQDNTGEKPRKKA